MLMSACISNKKVNQLKIALAEAVFVFLPVKSNILYNMTRISNSTLSMNEEHTLNGVGWGHADVLC